MNGSRRRMTGSRRRRTKCRRTKYLLKVCIERLRAVLQC
jgi:hypothetical protein